MKNINVSYFTTKSKIFAIAIQFITDKRYYKFTNQDDNSITYSFEINNDEKDNFYKKLKQLQDIKFS
jgi:hypothetical protein